jgi:hypothetical protein
MPPGLLIPGQVLEITLTSFPTTRCGGENVVGCGAAGCSSLLLFAAGSVVAVSMALKEAMMGENDPTATLFGSVVISVLLMGERV